MLFMVTVLDWRHNVREEKYMRWYQIKSLKRRKGEGDLQYKFASCKRNCECFQFFLSVKIKRLKSKERKLYKGTEIFTLNFVEVQLALIIIFTNSSE